MTAFCAICTDDIAGEPRREPLGRNGAEVAVCVACATQPVVAWDATRGYESQGSKGSMAARLAELAAEMPRMAPQQCASEVRQVSPGFLLVKVRAKALTGKVRDAQEAKRALRFEPWYRELRHLGSSITRGVVWHLYERPDPKFTRPVHEADPLASVEQYRRKP